jgi:hypothetical protein
LGSISS